MQPKATPDEKAPIASDLDYEVKLLAETQGITLDEARKRLQEADTFEAARRQGPSS